MKITNGDDSALDALVRDRSAKVAKRRNEMPVNGRGTKLLQEIIVKKAAQAEKGKK